MVLKHRCSKSMPFAIQPTFDHFNSDCVCYLDPHCEKISDVKMLTYIGNLSTGHQQLLLLVYKSLTWHPNSRNLCCFWCWNGLSKRGQRSRGLFVQLWSSFWAKALKRNHCVWYPNEKCPKFGFNGWMSNGPVFKCHLNAVQPNHLNTDKWTPSCFHMYWSIIQIVGLVHRT